MPVGAVRLTPLVKTRLPPFRGPEVLTDRPPLTDRVADRPTTTKLCAAVSRTFLADTGYK